jgi:hypothetical protein
MFVVLYFILYNYTQGQTMAIGFCLAMVLLKHRAGYQLL